VDKKASPAKSHNQALTIIPMTEEEHRKHDQEAQERIVQDVTQYGFHMALLEGDDYMPAFVYTIGLYQTYKHPEIICFGLPTNLMSSIISHAGRLIKSGEKFNPNQPYQGFLEGYSIQFLTVAQEHYPDYLGYAHWFYEGCHFPVVQLLWPDKQHLYPWEEGFNPHWKFKQPLLDRNTDFKFYEESNRAVYTSKQVLAGEPILYVYHDEEGDWQFYSEADPQLEDARLVCLEDVVKLDPSINKIYYLPYGRSAWRESIHAQWQRECFTKCVNIFGCTIFLVCHKLSLTRSGYKMAN
jgi:hypothetical protein